jgi:diguanylate cyclase (GGDEF)-like protein
VPTGRNFIVKQFDTLRVRRAIFLSAGGLAVFLSYVAVMTGTAPDASFGPVSVASVAFPGLVTGFVMVAYVAWETRNVRLASHHLDELNTQLVRKEIELGRLSTLDELTRLYTRHEFEKSVRLEFERRRRYRRDLSLLLIDVEHVAGAGDARLSKMYLLSEVAGIFSNVLRANDIGGRYTNERLGLLLPETDEIRAQLVADKLRAAVATHQYLGALADGRPRVSVSVGVAVAGDDFSTHEELLKAAEHALGEAIGAGLNQVHVYRRDAAGRNEPPSAPYRLTG